MLLATHHFRKTWPCSLSEDSGSLVHSCTGLLDVDIFWVLYEWINMVGQHNISEVFAVPWLSLLFDGPFSLFTVNIKKTPTPCSLQFLSDLSPCWMSYLWRAQILLVGMSNLLNEKFIQRSQEKKSSEVNSLKSSQNHIWSYHVLLCQLWCWKLVKSLCANGLKEPLDTR